MKLAFLLNLHLFDSLSSFLKDTPLIVIVLIAFSDSLETNNRTAMGMSITIMALIYLKSFFLSFNEGKLKITRSKLIIVQAVLFLLNLIHFSWILNDDKKDLDNFFKGIKYSILQKLYLKTLKFSFLKICSLCYVSIISIISLEFDGFNLAFIIVANIIYSAHMILTKNCKQKRNQRQLKIITREKVKNFPTIIPLDILLFDENEINFIIDNNKKVLFTNKLLIDLFFLQLPIRSLKKSRITFENLKIYFKDFNFSLVYKSKRIIEHEELDKTMSVEEFSNSKNIYSFLQIIDIVFKEFKSFNYKSWIFEYSDTTTSKILIVHNFNDQYLLKSKEIKDERKKEKIQKSQSRIVNLISLIEHEVRTTLNSIFSTFQVIESNQDENMKLMINSGLMSAKIFLNITNNLLDYLRIQSKIFSLNNVEFELEILVKEAVQVIKSPMENRGLSINLHNLLKKKFVCTDLNRVSQIIINLLLNILKFTTVSPINIILLPLDEDELKIEIQISGIGGGITESDQKTLIKALSKSKKKEIEALNSQIVSLGFIISNYIAFELTNQQQGISLVTSSQKEVIFKFYFQDSVQEHDCTISEISHDSIEYLPDLKCKMIGELNTFSDSGKNKLSFTNTLSSGFKSSAFSINSFCSALSRKSYLFNKPINNNSDNSNSNSKMMKSIKNMINSEGLMISEIALKSFYEEDFNIEREIENFKIMMKGKNCFCPLAIIIDDNDFNILALKYLLKKVGILADTSLSANDALSKMKNIFENNFCCKFYTFIFLDIEMPEKDGLQCYDEIIEYCSSKQIEGFFVVAVTAHHYSSEIMVRIKEKGIKNILIKPVSLETLILQISKIYKKFNQ